MQINDDRIIELETKISYQEDLIQELNKHVIDQQKQIDTLTNLYESLKEQFIEILSNLPNTIACEDKPSHY